MYAGVVEPSSSPNNTQPKLIRFLAKANRSQYVYVAGNSDPNDSNNQWWTAVPNDVVAATKSFLARHMASPPPEIGKTVVSLPFGTIETKAGWRPLNASEIASGRFHTQRVRFYEGPPATPCYRDATWGLVALHIIQKTPSAPYFIYATFEQADNILTADAPVPATATTPQVCLRDPKPPVSARQDTSDLASVILTADPTTCQPLPPTASYCDSPVAPCSVD